MKKLLSFMIVLVALLATNTIKAQVLLTEDFNYTVGTQLNTQGWIIQSGAGTNPISTINPGLAYPGYTGAGINNSVFLNTSGEDIYKRLSDSTDATNVYASFLLNITSAFAEPSAGDYFVHFTQNGTNFRCKLFARRNASNKISFNLTISGAGSVGTWTNYDYDLNTTYLVVMKYEFQPNANDDIVKLWINPVISTTEPTPTLTHNNTGETDATMIARFALRQGSSTNCPSSMIDGIRVARTWGELFPTVAIDWANLQWPSNGTINQGDNFSVYARTYIAGITSQAGATPGLQCWIGYSSTNTDPSTWTNWVPAYYNLDESNNDEFMANIGTAITSSGVYYYASRWKYSAGQYYYGGLNDGFWDGTTHPSGVLTVNEKPTISDVQQNPLSPAPTQNVDISATIVDNDGTIKWAKVYWATSTIADSATANKVAMTNASGNTFTAQIPAQSNGTTVYWFIAASDNANAIATTSETSYNVYSNVPPAISNIQHTPAVPMFNEAVDVTSDITDNGTISWAKLYWSTSPISDTATVNKVAMTNTTGNTFTAQIPAQANGTTVYYRIGASDNEGGLALSDETNYTVTNPTATINKAAYIPDNMIFVIYNSKVPLANVSNYTIKIGGTNTVNPIAIDILEGTSADTVVLLFSEGALPVDNVIDTIVDNFYSANYHLYACLMPISYTNTTNPNGVIENNIPATFRGLVTADEEYKQVWMQDGPNEYQGVMVFDDSQQLKNFVNVGDMITLVATRTVYNNNTELIPQAILGVVTAYATPQPTIIDAAELDYNIVAETNPAEQWEGQFIQINELKITAYNNTYKEYTAYTCDNTQITIDDDVWYQYGSTTPFNIGTIYNVQGIVTFTAGHYKLCPRSGADISLTPFDIAEINAPANQIPNGNADVTIYNNSSNPFEVIRFDLVDGTGIDGLPIIIDTLAIKFENESTIDIQNDIEGIKFVKNNATDIIFTGTPVIEGNIVKFAFANGDFNATNGLTAEISIWMWFNVSGKDKIIKLSVNTTNQVAFEPTCSSSPLKETDDDVIGGTITLYDPNDIVNISNNLKVYPNPATEIVSINADFTKVEFINTLGQIVLIATNNNNINISELPQGVYTLRIFTNNEIVTKQIIKK